MTPRDPKGPCDLARYTVGYYGPPVGNHPLPVRFFRYLPDD